MLGMTMDLVILLMCLLGVSSAVQINCPNRCMCLPENTVVCSKMDLTGIPPNIPEDTEHLDLSDNLIQRIQTQQFSHMKKLKRIVLNRNRVFVIRPFAFEGLPSLKNIEIMENPINRLKSHSFSGLSGMESIDLSYNKIETIEADVFAGSSNIRRISFNYNPLKIIKSHAFRNLTGVRELFFVLHDGDLTTIEPDAFDGLSNVGTLTIMNPSVKKLGKYTFRGLRNVHTLNVAASDIATIEPQAFDGTEVIKKVNLNEIGIKVIKPFAFYGMKDIGTLNLADNPITDLLPGSLYGLAGNVGHLDFGNSRFTCDCNLYWLTGYDEDELSRKHVRTITCGAPASYNGTSVTDVNFSEQHCAPVVVPSEPEPDEERRQNQLENEKRSSPDGSDSVKAALSTLLLCTTSAILRAYSCVN